MSWLRKALHTLDSTSQMVDDMMSTTRIPEDLPSPRIDLTKETSPLKQQLWLAQIVQTIKEAKEAESLLAEKQVAFQEEDEVYEPETQNLKYYDEQQEVGLVMDYSSFDDDAESVSSIDLLFNWLSCREMPNEKLRIDHRGKLVVATESLVSEDLPWHHEDPKFRQRRVVHHAHGGR